MNLSNTLVDVANAALALLGDRSITSLDSTDLNARCCRASLDGVIREEQQRFDWNELRVDAECAQVTSDVEGYYCFLKPADMLQARVWSSTPVFRGGRLYCSSSTLSISYTKISDNVGEWSAELFACVSLALACATARTITGNERLLGALHDKLVNVTRPDAYRLQCEARGPENYRESISEYRDAFSR